MDIRDRVSGPGVFTGSRVLGGSLHSVRRDTDTGVSPIVHPGSIKVMAFHNAIVNDPGHVADHRAA